MPRQVVEGLKKAGLPRGLSALCALVVTGLVASACSSGGHHGYQVNFVFPSAPNLIKGSPVMVGGFTAGKLTRLDARDGQAIVGVSLKDEYAPLRSGTTARIAYESLVGERRVEITPGAKDAAPLPDGALVSGNTVRVELNDVLNALDPETRSALQRLLPGLDAALADHEGAVNATLASAGPAVDALGDVLAALGQDGSALRRLVTSVRDLVERLNSRRDSVRTALDGLGSTLSATAMEEERLALSLEALPRTLATADSTLAQVPPAARAILPLLFDLRPVVNALPGVAAELRPLLTELDPLLSDLPPALSSLANLLAETGPLLDRAATTVPPLTAGLSALLPAVDFLRPYTPELAGAVANVASATAGYDPNGHYSRVAAVFGSGISADSDGNLSPSLYQRPHREPGEAEDPPADATGSPLR